MNDQNQNDQGAPSASFVIRNSGLIRYSGFWFRNSAAIFAVLAFAACSLAAAIFSRGFLESDGATHYLFARHALEQPIFFTDIWGRPVCTGLFAIPAALGGLLAVRITSMLVAIGCGLVSMAIARGQGYALPALALIFTLGEPLVFLHSFSELTELPFALIIGLAVLCYQRKHFGAMAFFAAIGPLARPEGFAFLVLAAIALLIHRKWWPLAILPIGLLAWSIAGYTMDGPADRPWWKWLIDHWPYEAGSEYPRGPILFYLGVLPMVVGPFALPAMWIGAWQSIARTPNRSSGCTSGASPHTMDRLIAALPLCLLIGYSLLFWLGKFSSSGSPRYLLIVAPLWGCLAARGWQWVFDRMRWQRAASWAALAVVVPGVVNWIYPFLPLKQSASWSQAEKFVAWYQTSRFRNEFPRVMCNHPGIYFYSDRSPWDRRVVQPWAPEAIDRPVPDVVLVWDREFCTQNSDPKLVASLHRIANAGWVEDRAAEALSDVSFPNVPPKQLKWDHPDELKIFVAGR